MAFCVPRLVVALGNRLPRCVSVPGWICCCPVGVQASLVGQALALAPQLLLGQGV
jgi:hypothetical protein